MGSIPVARLCLNKSASLIVSISNGLGGGGAKQKTLFLSEAKNPFFERSKKQSFAPLQSPPGTGSPLLLFLSEGHSKKVFFYLGAPAQKKGAPQVLIHCTPLWGGAQRGALAPLVERSHS